MMGWGRGDLTRLCRAQFGLDLFRRSEDAMSASNVGFANIEAREQGLRRSLSARKLSMIAIGGAIGTGLFLGSGFAISLAGPGVLISYVIGAVVALLLMGCLAEMTVTHPLTGSFGAYAEYYVGPLAGFLVRWCYWTGNVLAVGTEVTAVAVYMKYWFPAPPGWLWIFMFSGGLVLANALAVNIFGTVEYWFSVVKVTAITAFIVLASYLVFGTAAPTGFANYTAHGGFLPHGWWGAWVAVMVAVFSYLSLELIAVAAGEAEQPQIAIMRAFRSTVIRLILFYLLTLALMLAFMPWTDAGTGESPFVRAMRAAHIPAAAGVVNFVILVAALSAMNSLLYASTRMMFSLSRAGQAPRRFGVLNRRGVPLQALLLSSSGVALAAVLGAISPERAYIVMLSVSGFGVMFVWMMIFITHYFFRRARIRRAESTSRFRMWGYPFTTLFGAGLMASVLITTLFNQLFRMTLVFGIPFLGLLSVIYYLWYRESPRDA
jgi:L-asparagine transporter-like permease